ARRWVAAGWLPAAQREVRLGRHALWLVWEDDLARFLRDCRPVYDPARIRDPHWRALVAALPPERDPWLTPCEAAPLLRLTAHGVRRRIATGHLATRTGSIAKKRFTAALDDTYLATLLAGLAPHHTPGHA